MTLYNGYDLTTQCFKDEELPRSVAVDLGAIEETGKSVPADAGNELGKGEYAKTAYVGTADYLAKVGELGGTPMVFVLNGNNLAIFGNEDFLMSVILGIDEKIKEYIIDALDAMRAVRAYDRVTKMLSEDPNTTVACPDDVDKLREDAQAIKLIPWDGDDADKEVWAAFKEASTAVFSISEFQAKAFLTGTRH